METFADFKISKRKLKGLLHDAEKSAEIIDLVYVSDKDAGIERVKRGKGCVYIKNGNQVTDEKQLLRIRQLVIPPAWENVWICTLPNGHLQATGIDTKKRKQYLYHREWSAFRNQTKFFQLVSFGKKLPSIRKQLETDLSKPGLPVEKVLAAVITIMQYTSIRVGNTMYEKLYGSFGLTTLKDKHVTVNGNTVKFCFKGKKGIYHEIDLKSGKLARIVKQCRDIPGKELFQYYDEHGEKKPIDSGMVNDYIKNICSDTFTTKDFRTWTGTVYAIEALNELGSCDSEAEIKKRTVEALDIVAKRLGNTRAICKKYYVHPIVLDLYGSSQLAGHFHGERIKTVEGLTEIESILMDILESST
jgi:DNA topoisomerase-1